MHPALPARRRREALPALLLGWAAFTLVTLALPAAAQETETASQWRFSGFGTLGLTHNDLPNGWGLRRELSQAGSGTGLRADVDSRLGAQVNYTPDAQFELVAQVVARRRASEARASDSIEWAYGTYRPDSRWTLRAGRVNMDAFLMADYRNVGFGYLMARPPIEFYASLPTSLDGGDATRSWTVGDAQWRVKGFGGRTRFGDQSLDAVGKLQVFGLMASRETQGLLVRASVARVRLSANPARLQPLLDGLDAVAALPVPDVAAQAADLRHRLDLGDIDATYLDLGLRSEQGDWQWSAEITRMAGHPAVQATAAYFNIGRRIGSVTYYVGASAIRTPGDALAGTDWAGRLAPVIGDQAAGGAQQLGLAAVGAANGTRARQQSVSVGLRWDLHPQAALKLQYDHIRTSTNGARLWSDATLAAGRAGVTTVLLDFVF